jgi:SAM-dependent methyltransferase
MKKECKNYISSQYYPNEPWGVYIKDERNENLEVQTFSDSMFDIVITQDVFEHLYNPDRAFLEIARTLKHNGAHIFTVPIVNKHKKTEQWAICGNDGNPIFLKTKEWHGNPIDDRGSPVTYHWGYDIVDIIKDKTGLNTQIEYMNNLNFGIQGEYLEVLVTQKK